MPRRAEHCLPRGGRSSGAAVLVPMITYKWAGIKERAELALLHVGRSAVQEGDPVVSMAWMLDRCAPAAAMSSSHHPDLTQVAEGSPGASYRPLHRPPPMCARRCCAQANRSKFSSLWTDWHGSSCTSPAYLVARLVSASEGPQGLAPMKLTAPRDGSRGRVGHPDGHVW